MLHRRSIRGRRVFVTGVAAPALGLIVGLAAPARAEVLWRGDFEGGNTKQWTGTLKARGLSVVDDPTREGARAARIEITSADLWSNGLNRVELQRRPAASRTAEGAEVYFGWSFQLPKALVSGGHQIGYWESDKSYRQIMSLTISGADLQLSTRLPQNKRVWTAPGKATTGVWHDVVMHVKWSTDPAVGFVSLWYDGQQVVNRAPAQTLADANGTFIQVGFLRGNKTAEPEVMFLDRAIEATTLEDVLAATAPGGSADGGFGGTSGNDFDAAAAVDTANAGGRSGGRGGAGGTPSPQDEDEPPTSDGRADRAGCSVGGAGASRSGDHAVLAAAALLALMVARRSARGT